MRDEFKKKTSRSIKIKKNQKNKDQMKKKYKLKNTIEFLNTPH